MMVYESNCSDIENHRSVGNSVNKLEDKIEKNQPEVLAKPGEELAKSHKPVSDMKCEGTRRPITSGKRLIMLSQASHPRIVMHLKILKMILPVLRLNCRKIQLLLKLDVRLQPRIQPHVNSLLHPHADQ